MILKNFYYVDCFALKNTTTVNHVFDSSLIFKNKSKLKLAISPVTKERTVEFSKPYERKNEKTNARQKLFRVEEVVSRRRSSRYPCFSGDAGNTANVGEN